MMIQAFRVPESPAELERVLRLFMADTYPSAILNNGQPGTFQVDLQGPEGARQYFITVETAEQYAGRVQPDDDGPIEFGISPN